MRPRIYSQLCPWRLWAWRRLSWRLRAQSYDTPRIASTADARFSKPDSGPVRGTYAAARHQRAVGAEPIWRGYVARLVSFGVVRDHRDSGREYRCFLASRNWRVATFRCGAELRTRSEQSGHRSGSQSRSAGARAKLQLVDEQRPHPMRRKNLREVRTPGAKRVLGQLGLPLTKKIWRSRRSPEPGR